MRYTLTLLLSLFTLIGTPSSAYSQNRDIRLAAYGVRPGADSLSSKFRKALEDIRRIYPDNQALTLHFEPGKYVFHSQDASVREIYISNHDQPGERAIALNLDGWKNLTIDGGGSQFWFEGRLIPIVLSHCTGCTLRNFSIDFVHPQVMQVTVVRNNGADGIDFLPSTEAQWRINANGRVEGYGEGWAQDFLTGNAFDPVTHHILYRTADLAPDLRQISTLPLDEGTALIAQLPEHSLQGNPRHLSSSDTSVRVLHAPLWQDSRLPVGTLVALRGYERPCPGIFLGNDTDTHIHNVRVSSCEGMGLIAHMCQDIDLQGLRITPSPSDKYGRRYSSQADATHFSHCRGHISSVGGVYEGMLDDAINVHGIYLKVRERLDAHTLRCTYEHDQAWGFDWGNVGDTIQIIRSRTMDTVDMPANIIAAIRPDGDPKAPAKGFIITLRDAIPAEIGAQTDETFGIENLTWTPSVRFAHNTVRNNRARGALFSSPRRTVCEDNFFDHTSGCAILLCGDCNGWYESGAVRDLVIRRNVFLNALTSMYQFTEGVISIYPEIPDLEGAKQYFHGTPGKSGILIEDNIFDTFGTPLLFAKSTQGLIFRNNAVKRNNDFEPYHQDAQPIRLLKVKDIFCDGRMITE